MHPQTLNNNRSRPQYIYIYNNTFCNLFIWQILTHLGKLFISFWCFLLFFCCFNLLYIVTGKKPGNQDLWSNSDIKLVSMDSAVCLPWVQVNIKLVRTGILWTVHAKMTHHNNWKRPNAKTLIIYNSSFKMSKCIRWKWSGYFKLSLLERYYLVLLLVLPCFTILNIHIYTCKWSDNICYIWYQWVRAKQLSWWRMESFSKYSNW